MVKNSSRIKNSIQIKDKYIKFEKLLLGDIMSKVIFDKECGCFKRSEYQNNAEYATKEEALTKALEMAEDMNETFCKKHNFSVVEEGEDIIVKVAMN